MHKNVHDSLLRSGRTAVATAFHQLMKLRVQADYHSSVEEVEAKARLALELAQQITKTLLPRR